MSDAQKIALRIACRTGDLSVGYNVVEGCRLTVAPATISALERAGLVVRSAHGDLGSSRWQLTPSGAVRADEIGPISILVGTRSL